MQPIALGFIKLSFLFFYRRIFKGRVWDIVSWSMIAIVACWTIAFFFGFIFDCQLDFVANWGSLAETGRVCGFGFLPTIIYTILDAVLDLVILIMPLPLVSKQTILSLPLSRLTCLSDIRATDVIKKKSSSVWNISAWKLVGSPNDYLQLLC